MRDGIRLRSLVVWIDLYQSATVSSHPERSSKRLIHDGAWYYGRTTYDIDSIYDIISPEGKSLMQGGCIRTALDEPLQCVYPTHERGCEMENRGLHSI